MSSPTNSSVSICNSALLKVGADIISSLDDGTRAANICKIMYPILRDEAQQAAPWRFCLLQVQLTPNLVPPSFDYLNSFALPLDCLRVWRVNSAKWTVKQGNILCDNTLVDLLYIQRNTDESTWDSCFVEALAWRMAMEIALALIQSVPLKQDAEKSYMAALAQCRAENATLGTPERLVADIWSGAHKGYDYFHAIDAGPSEVYGP